MNKKKLVPFLISIIILILFSIFLEFEKGENLSVYYLDVGQGDSALIETPNGIQILVDAGKNEKVIKELEQIIPFWDRHIDLLVLTHGDLDHIGGFFEILETYEIGKILRAQTEIDSKYLEELLAQANDTEIFVQEVGEGDKIILDQSQEIYIDFFWPPKNNLEDSNENSLVFELIHKENEFLFTGDATIETELEIIKKFPNKIETDVLKVGHHGSKTSTSQYFLEKTTPDFSILSYGENSYGHPNSEVLKRLDEVGGEIFHTKDRATIVARSDGQNIKLKYLYFLK